MVTKSNLTVLEEIKDLSGVTPAKCMQCGRCSASCPVSDVMDLHPHGFVASLKNGDAEALISNGAKWECLSCYTCSQRCPRDVKPGALLEASRQLYLRQKGNTKFTPESAQAQTSKTMPQQLIVSMFRKMHK